MILPPLPPKQYGVTKPISIAGSMEGDMQRTHEKSSNYQDYTPCTNPKRWKKYGAHRLTFMERHCPPVFERKECLIPPPNGYKPPIKWPKSRDECWYRNVPYDWINKQKSNKNWLRKQGEKFLFPGGGTMFPKGVGAYVDLMRDLIPEMKDGTVRTAIDTGCGVASWGGDLLDRGILTVSLAPRDNHEAQVQLHQEIIMKLKFNLHWNVEFPQFLASFPHNAYLSPQIHLIWLIAQDALSRGQNSVISHIL
ncbi:putative methyltransferase PMT21 [Citrus sinensis]|uniref:Methyltransferase PMT21 n=1 Tax=Citrus sinensis TaxID=2711 RepID=A0ACB8M0W2_CITSI|nr:putative methyltransferase PMT21 [Citrus sinensis]